MEWEGEIRFVTYRGDAWNWEERLGRFTGTPRVNENIHSDASRNLLWKNVAEVLKKGQCFCRKNSVLGGWVREAIRDKVLQIPACFQIFIKNPYFGSLFPVLNVYKTYFPVFHLPVQHVQIMITNSRITISSLPFAQFHALWQSWMSYARASYAHIHSNVKSRSTPHHTTLHHLVLCAATYVCSSVLPA